MPLPAIISGIAGAIGGAKGLGAIAGGALASGLSSRITRWAAGDRASYTGTRGPYELDRQAQHTSHHIAAQGSQQQHSQGQAIAAQYALEDIRQKGNLAAIAEQNRQHRLNMLFQKNLYPPLSYDGDTSNGDIPARQPMNPFTLKPHTPAPFKQYEPGGAGRVHPHWGPDALPVGN